MKTKKTFRITVRLKDTDVILDRELGPGVIGYRDLTYNEEPETYREEIFAFDLMRRKDEFIKENIECIVEEYKNDNLE